MIHLDLPTSNEKPITIIPEGSPEERPSARCKSYRKSDGSLVCGFLLEQIFSWFEASEKCKALGARLPEIKSEEDNEQILELKV